MKKILFALLMINLIVGCKNNTPDETVAASVEFEDKNIAKPQTDTILHPILGKRLKISGDFDGDGKKEDLVEHYISQTTKTETNKSYANNIDYSELVGLIKAKKPQSFVTSSNPEIDSLPISSELQLFGLMFLKNEGDLNNDGNDEVAYVVDWADWSNTNTYHIVSYVNKKWINIHSFPIWEWQFNDLKNNQGLVKKLNNSEIEYYYSNDESVLDTMILKLNTNF